MPNGRGSRPPALSHADWVRLSAVPLHGVPEDFDACLDEVGEARIVMLGEASHGTAEFYATRARLTRHLIEEKGFTFVAIEGDWPDAARVNRYVRGAPEDALSALGGFKRFPIWMWRNTVVLSFIDWLRGWNDRRSPESRVGFYGLDLYSLHASMEAVVAYLERVDPAAAERARERYACFEPFGEDTRQYALDAHFLAASCEEELISTLLDLREQRARYAALSSRDEAFEAELNAIAAADAESYYRQMVRGGAVTWNLRDRHMVATLERLLAHLGPDAKAILWEHNSHIGDFRATYEGQSGHLNVGQLVRERHGSDAFAVGFGTYRGTVTAARAWDGPPEFMRVPPAREDSIEAAFHQANIPSFYLGLRDLARGGAWLAETRPERAIGVVYNPAEERFGNYVPSRLAARYDAYVFHDETLAVEPLDLGPEPPGLETYPSGL
ncbi:erythromycin esterase family protein [bacterium]|nr:erythromycin esterase family protein [bacterium]